MKLIHLSDLHLGKRIYAYSLLEDQEFILSEIVRIADAEAPDAVVIAGDIYDKSVPPAEAVSLLDSFLVRLSEHAPVLLISGNHDSAERIAFGARLMERSGIFLSPVYDGNIRPVSFRDAFGTVDVWLLPFVRPSAVRHALEEEKIGSYEDAIRAALAGLPLDKSRRNVLVTHQFVTGAARSESEDISVGGTDNVDASVFDGFDYVALGHLHSPQNCGSQRIRYCGTPLKYSFSEASDHKSVTVAELGEKGSLTVRTVPLVPKRDMAELRGSFSELMNRQFYINSPWQEDYVHITLTDEDDVQDAVLKLRTVYHNLMSLDYDNTRTRTNRTVEAAEDVETKTPQELFADFFAAQNGRPMSEQQKKYMDELIEKQREDGK